MSPPAVVVVHYPYHYTPTEWIAVVFVVLFSVSTILHLAQAIRYRLWWLIATPVIAGILEICGWSARLWSSQTPTSINPYIMQMTTTIIAPTFLISANFVILGQIILRLGHHYSRLNAVWYAVVFTSFDVVALVIQAVGGASAAAAVNKQTSTASGGHIMLGGICFQMVSLTAYLLLAFEFILRFLWNRPLRSASAYVHKPAGLDKNTRCMLASLVISSIFIYIRSVYRTIELADGWTGPIIATQVYFNVFDGAMITLAMCTLNLLHPGALLGPGDTWLSLRATRQSAGEDTQPSCDRNRQDAKSGSMTASVEKD